MSILNPITITVLLSAGEMALANSVESNLVILCYRDGSWEPLPTTVDFSSCNVTPDWSPAGTRIA